MEHMIYAPVYIPTLNRYECLKRCLESLELCTGSGETEVYVALDYPPSDKYLEGWKKNDAYLKEKESNNHFKKLIVIRRNYNCGIGGPSSNGNLLKKIILSKYDRYIYTEDDNLFSPNFLEYINKGLELYKNNKRVMAICGYKNDFNCKYEGNNHFAQHSLQQAWGVGTWVNKELIIQEELTPAYFRRILFSHKKWLKCYKYWPHWFMTIVRNAMSTNNNCPAHDTNRGFYMINENKCVICPTISKVRNMGWDSQATTTYLEKGNLRGRAEHELNLVIDSAKTFEFEGDPFQFEEENSLAIAQWDGQWETGRMRSLWRIYPRIWAYRILAFLGIV